VKPDTQVEMNVFTSGFTSSLPIVMGTWMSSPQASAPKSSEGMLSRRRGVQHRNLAHKACDEPDDERLGHVRSDDDNGQAVGGDNEVRLHAEGGEQAAHRELQHGTGGQKHGHQDEILDGQSLLLSRITVRLAPAAGVAVSASAVIRSSAMSISPFSGGFPTAPRARFLRAFQFVAIAPSPTPFERFPADPNKKGSVLRLKDRSLDLRCHL